MPPREIRDLFVPLDRYEKLRRKGISIEEVREAVRNAPDIRVGPKNTSPAQAGRCYFVCGRTDAGRRLKVLIRRFDGGYARLITAWESPK